MGLFDMLKSGLFGLGGTNDPRLSGAQNMEAARGGLRTAGLTMMANAGQPGLAPIATGLLAGQEAGAAQRSGIMARDNAMQMAELFKSGEADPRLLEKAFGQALASGDVEAARALSPILSASIAAGSRQPKSLQNVDAVMPDGREVMAVFDPTTGQYTVDGMPVQGLRPRAQRPLVDMGQTQEGALNRRFGEVTGEDLSAAMTAGRTAQQDIARYGQLETLLSTPGVYQGTAGDAVLRLKQAGQALGIDVEGVPESQAARAIGNQLALTLRNPAGGAGMPGALSDKDREFLVQMVPSLTNTADGNRILVQAARKMAERNIEVSNVIRRYAQQNGGVMDVGVYDAIEQSFRGSDLFGGLSGPASPYADLVPR
jgi:hypothetical protein